MASQTRTDKGSQYDTTHTDNSTTESSSKIKNRQKTPYAGRSKPRPLSEPNFIIKSDVKKVFF